MSDKALVIDDLTSPRLQPWQREVLDQFEAQSIDLDPEVLVAAASRPHARSDTNSVARSRASRLVKNSRIAWRPTRGSLPTGSSTVASSAKRATMSSGLPLPTKSRCARPR